MAIRLFLGAFPVSLGAYAIYYIVMAYTSDENAIEIKAILFILFVVVIGISLAIFRYLETRRLLKNSILYEYQWSEDLFSLLIQGLPEDASKEEITNHFNGILSEQGIDGTVRNILLLQDPKLYAGLKKKLVAIDRNLDTAGEKEGLKEVLLDERERIESQLNTLKQELAELKHFKGKAIVTFDTIEAKEAIRRYFEATLLKQIAISFSKSNYSRYFLRDHRVQAKEITEPENIIFENIHTSNLKKAVYTVIAFLLSQIFVVFFSLLLSENEGLNYKIRN